jgi:hypothetical protein
MLFKPWCIVNLGHKALELAVHGVIAIIKTHGIEAVPEVSQMSQHSNRALWAPAQFFFHQIPDGPIEGDVRLPEVIFSAKIGQIDVLCGPERMYVKHIGQFRQIKVHQIEPVLKYIDNRCKPSVPDPSMVYAAFHIKGSFRRICTQRAHF